MHEASSFKNLYDPFLTNGPYDAKIAVKSEK